MCELDDKIDRLTIRRQLDLLVTNLAAAKERLDVSNILWERAMAADGLLNADELKLFDSAADNLISIRSLVGCRQKSVLEKETRGTTMTKSGHFGSRCEPSDGASV